MKNVLLVILCGMIAWQSHSQIHHVQYHDDVIYFQLDPIAEVQLPEYTGQEHHAVYNQLPSLSACLANYPVKNVRIAFPGMSSAALQNTYRIYFDEGRADLDNIITSLETDPLIIHAEKAPINYPCFTPNDPVYDAQWFLPYIETEEAWDIIDPKETVTVAVVDDAVLWEHEDLENNFWVNSAEVDGTPGVDDDGNGYVDDIIGWDGANWDNNPAPPGNADEEYFNHGTHVAGTVGAETNNNRGVAAISFNTARIMACKGGRDSDAIFTGIWDAYAYAVANNAPIINNSWGRGFQADGTPPADFAQFELDLLAEAQSKGLISVFAAGNQNKDLFLPAIHESVIAVAATGNSLTSEPDEKATYSNFGPWVDIAAPGTQVVSCTTGDEKYVPLNGTSMATPNVSSLIALMKSQNPDLNKQQIISCLYSSCDNISGDNPDHIGLLGVGRINVRKAIECVSGDVASCDVPQSLDVVDISENSVRLEWDNVSGAEGYTVEIKQATSNSWFSFEENPFATNWVNVNGLEACKEYDFRVQSLCDGGFSDFSNAFRFETDCSTNTAEECTEFAELYSNLGDGGDCANNPLSTPFEVWGNEAYIIYDCEPGQLFSFSMCDGYDPNVWEVLITVALVTDGETGDVITSANDCSLEFQIPGSVVSDIVIIIADANDCGGAHLQVDNGIATIDCISGGCDIPTSLSVSNVSANDALLQWQSVSDAVAYNIQARAIGDTEWAEGIGIQSTSATYSDLSPCTEYEFRVQAVCSSGSSNYSTTFSFTTEGCNMDCPSVSSIDIENIQSTSAEINWSSVAGATKYEIYYKPQESNNWFIEEAETTSFQLEGLTPCLFYEVQITAACNNGPSEPSVIVNFETECINCEPIEGLQVVAITNDKASIVWQQSDTHLSYQLRAKRVQDSEWSVFDISSNGATYTGLDACTDYEVQVNAICSDGESGFSTSNIFKTIGCSGEPDCSAFGENTQDEWIERIDIGNLSNSSGNNFGYQYFNEFSNIIFEETIDYSVNLSPGFTATEYPEYWRIWIDLNRDGDFEDANELVFESDSPSANPQSGSFTMPNVESSGLTTMRVIMKYTDTGNDSDLPESCGSFNYGEVEDYQITIDKIVSNEDWQEKPYVLAPNPAITETQILGLQADETWRLTDALGKTIAKGSFGDPSVRLAELAAGQYWIIVENEKAERVEILPVIKI